MFIFIKTHEQSFVNVRFIMSNLPVPVSEKEVEEMLKTADINKDGTIDFQEFRVMLGL